jgi:hypothetical protein
VYGVNGKAGKLTGGNGLVKVISRSFWTILDARSWHRGRVAAGEALQDNLTFVS